MSPKRLLEHFEQINEAPDAVPRLRRFILDLAVRGKLVEQDSKDELATVLLKQIQIEKERLIRSDEISKGKPLLPIDPGAMPFDLPSSWVWERLGNVTSYIQRGKSPQYATKEGLPVISQKCVQWDGLHLERARAITKSSLATYEPIRFLRDGDLLWNSTGTGTIGRLICLKDPPARLLCDSHVTVVRCLLMASNYVRIWLGSDAVYGNIEERAAGATNQVELTSGMALNQLVPIPPLAEQHRIVKKVDELMKLCDELEATQTKHERRRDRLVAATLHGLNNGEANDEYGETLSFRESACFYFNHLPRLTTRPEHIQQLRQIIHNLALQGKLVAQNPDEGSGQELLSRLKAAHAEARKFGGSRRKGQPPLDPLNCPALFEIPPSWRWSYLDFLCEQIGDIDHNMPKTVTEGVPFISAKDLKDDGTIDFSNHKMISEEDYACLSRKIQMRRDDIVYSRIGARLGKARLVDVDTRFLISYSCCLVRPMHKFIDKCYLRLFLDSKLALNQAHKGAQSIGVPDFGLGEIKEFKVPIPPLAEQRRIMAKVDELMKLCVELETRITTVSTTRRQLLEVTLQEALSVDAF